MVTESGQNRGAAGEQSVTGTPSRGSLGSVSIESTARGSLAGVSAEPTASSGRIRVFRDVLPDLPHVPGWPTHTDDVVSDEAWAVLGPELAAMEKEPGMHVTRVPGYRGIRSGDF